jgi:leader peptidase (prepilin peptidase)/N-methyltransferase
VTSPWQIVAIAAGFGMIVGAFLARAIYAGAQRLRRNVGVAVVMGALFAAVTARFGAGLELPAFLFLGTIGVALALLDLERRPIPDGVVLAAYVVSVLLLMPAGAVAGNLEASGRALGGVAAFTGIYFALRISHPHALDSGSVKLAGLLGLYLGWLGLDALLLGAFLGLAIAAIGGVARNWTAPRHSAHATALAPSMVAVPAASWYGSLLMVRS